MGENLVIRLTGGEPEWAVVDAGGFLLGPAERGDLTAAAALAPGRRVLVLVPSHQVLRVRADVPLRGAGRVAQALPFALEDQLADDLEDLHFAAGTRAPDGRVPAAVVRRDLLDGWLALLRAAGLEPAGLFADSDGVVTVAGTATLLVEPGQVVLRDSDGDAVVVEPAATREVLELWLSQQPAIVPDGPQPGRNLQVYVADGATGDQEPWSGLADRLDNVDVRRLPDGALPRLAAGIVTGGGVNLLQGLYTRRSTVANQLARWQLPAALAAGLAILALGLTAADLWRLQREAARLQATIDEAARYAFPDAAPTDDIRRLLEQRLGGLAGSAGPAAGNRQFLDTLRVVAEAVTGADRASLESLSYRGGVLELQVRAPNAESLDAIRRSVTAGGQLQAEIQSANAAGDEIQGRIRITGGGA